MNEKRTGERRAGYAPDDCPNYVNNKAAMDEINTRLDDGHARMTEMQTTIDANHKQTLIDRKRLEGKLDANSEATGELLEIIRMGKGFFKGLAWTGKWLRKILMWVLPLATAVLTFWYTITNHGPGQK